MKKSVLSILFLLLLLLINSNSASPQVFWEELPQMVTVPLYSASNYNGYIAYICGDSATVLKTTNGGYNWTNVSKNGIPPDIQLVNIFVVSVSVSLSHTVIASGYSGANTYVYRTTNSGANWTQVFSQSNGFVNAVWFTDANSGFMQGDPVGGRWSLWKSTNAGLNWDSTSLFLPSASTESGFANSLWKSGGNIWFGTNNSRVYHSTNNGSTWTIGSVAPETNSVAIWMGASPYNIGYSAGNTLYKSTNAGVNWALDISASGSGVIKSITGNTEIFNYTFYTRGSSIYYKFSSNWVLQYTSPAGVYNHMSMARVSMSFGPGWIYAVRSNGRISRANTFIEGVRLISNNVPDSYTLSQNYPNPFNPTTKFKFDTRRLPEMSTGEIRGGNVRISVYDNLGRETETLINKVLQPAEYEIDWDGSRYPSGVYFYRMLVTNPNGGVVVFDAVKKMVLMK